VAGRQDEHATFESEIVNKSRQELAKTIIERFRRDLAQPRAEVLRDPLTV
jgi:hypothetical protein